MTFREKLANEAKRHGETIADMIFHSLGFNLELNEEDVSDFTAWTPSRVYFPYMAEDGDTYEVHIASVPRNPCSEATWI